MSGHSHWATIQRSKGANDIIRGKLFSKLARAITIAAKEGGINPDSNLKLKIAIEKAKQNNMPKDNVDRAISKAAGGEALEEITYEGFGPLGISVLVEVATDNKNRSSQEIKNLFDKFGGKMGGPGSVAFNFSPMGQIIINKSNTNENSLLEFIDSGAEDVEEVGDSLIIYTKPHELMNVKHNIESKNYSIVSAELTQKAINFVEISKDDTQKAINFLTAMDEHDDVQKVYANANIKD